MNGVISFVIFCDWLLLLSVCFWGLSVLQHAPVLHLSPPPRFFLSVRLCSPFIHSCGRGSGCLLTSHSAYVYWLLLCTKHRLRRILLHAVHSAFVINMSHMRTLRFSFLFLSLSICVCVCVFKDLFIYFGYSGSSLLHGLSLVWQVGLLFVAVCGLTAMASLVEHRL